MRFDIDRLQAFYGSSLGRMAQEMVGRRVGALWPGLNGLDVLGLGHAEALLERYRAGARRVISAAPGEQGAEHWPEEGRSLTTLVEDERLPFPDALFDRIIVRHALEEAESPQRLLREIWRIAAPEARILIIVAHRRGLWARAESTPFGHGRPYTRTQLNRLLEDAMFSPQASARALFAPPIGWGVITSAGDAWEKIGGFAWSGFGGVLMVEAMKRIYIEPGKPARARRVVKAPQKRPAHTRSKRDQKDVEDV
jgi:SAM-dependent methyltransferase